MLFTGEKILSNQVTNDIYFYRRSRLYFIKSGIVSLNEQKLLIVDVLLPREVFHYITRVLQ